MSDLVERLRAAVTGSGGVDLNGPGLLTEAADALEAMGAREERLKSALAAVENGITFADYEEVLADHRRLVRELDVALNGDGAAKQASLCDLVAQAKHQTLDFGLFVRRAREAAEGE